ncbi:MAG: VanZ family protein [Thermoleophilia bacterium]|nr:VanZ family protein [Thermoleophilia bacterium]
MTTPQPPTNRRRRPIWLMLLVFWCLVIFALSAQPDLRVAHNDLADFVVRKLAHVVTYGALALLASMTFRQEGQPLTRLPIGAALFSLLYAASDEWHQTFVTGRHGSPVDVAIDMIGVTLVALLLQLRMRARTISTTSSGELP